ncbi:hypothetical protein niasHT_000851 [Heterodera trifolii]|uniref:G protein-coupled receptor n=1 Tax=Heterodera trifolii TaxID=157864 RepID=A0ABD2MCI9_9BILA
MDLLLFQRDKYDLLYNCTNFDANLVPIGQRIHTVHGIILIIMFFLFELLYIPCMLSMYNKLSNACYKLLFYIGITDMLVMLMNGFETGLLSINGAVFCTYPDLIYTSGSVGLSLWYAAELLLAINRCLELVAPKLAHQIYHGNRTWWLCIVPTVYAIILSLYTPPILFSGQYMSWFFNPYVGYVDDFVPQPNAHTFLQVVLISFFNGMAAGIYIYMQSVRISDALIIAGTYAWLLAHGIPPLIYLALNKTIRTDFVRYAKIIVYKCTHRSHQQQAQTLTILPMTSLRGVQLRGRNNANFVGTNANFHTRGNRNTIRPVSHAF